MRGGSSSKEKRLLISCCNSSFIKMWLKTGREQKRTSESQNRYHKPVQHVIFEKKHTDLTREQLALCVHAVLTSQVLWVLRL